ncbi:transposase [Streptomyces hygroscopicus subsp. jinggangensis 5008]|nr:transposase [Streptomyces hygroscopicus subsp. jinggangensis 5008]
MALDADGVRAFLHVPGLVDHQHRILVAQMLQHVVMHAVGIPPDNGGRLRLYAVQQYNRWSRPRRP